MGRARKEKDIVGELLNVLYGGIPLLSFYIWAKTGSLTTAGIIFIGACIVLFVVALIRRSLRRQKLLDSGLDIIDQMSGDTFEELLLLHFRNLGYKASLTPMTEDYGADLVLVKNGCKTVVQAKRWKHTVGIEAVQQVIGAIRHYGAEHGIVITNSYYSENAHKLAKSNYIELWDRPKLIEILQKSNGKALAEKVSTITKSQLAVTSEYCPRCGANLVVRNGKKGTFWGCTNYPKCRFTKDI